MTIVGITGTKGKSTTANMMWELLTDAGHVVGLTGTINIRIGKAVDQLVTSKMTMVGRFQLQKLLRQMVIAGCDIAIVETTSEGIKQWRHLGIEYDVCAFTNLMPEHLDSHGGFEQYKDAKLELFRHLSRLPVKRIGGKEVVRASVVNMDSEHGADFLDVGDYKKVTVGSAGGEDVSYSDVKEAIDGTDFVVNGTSVRLPVLGAWNASNAALGFGVGHVLGMTEQEMTDSIVDMDSVPGRMEFVDEGQDFAVIVDYAYEPNSLRLLYEFTRKLIGPENKIITLVSSTGGGRDVWRRPENGKTAAELCDFVIATDEDPYDDDPQQIIDEVFAGVLEGGKVKDENCWNILSRTEAIEKAVSLAKPGDVVITTAKGAEQKMVTAEGKIDWDDREVVREAIRGLR